MPSCPKLLITGSVYHVFNRGVEKRIIFPDKSYYQHFLTTLDYYKDNQPERLSLSAYLNNKPLIQPKAKDHLVSILCFCLMPNHFHLILKQLADGGISHYMNDIANSYTRYLNTRLERVGHLFQGSFKSKLIETESSFLQVTRYIHLNPTDLHPEGEKAMGIEPMEKLLRAYPYSSYKTYLGKETAYSICDQSEIRELIGAPNDYKNLVKSKLNQDARLGIENLTLD
mgnify:CR=1 FL=1